MGFLIRSAQWFWRNVTPNWCKCVLENYANELMLRNALNMALKVRQMDSTVGKQKTLIYSGFIDESSGIANAAKGSLKGIKKLGYNVIVQNAGIFWGKTVLGRALLVEDVEVKKGIWLLHCNPVEAVKVFNALKTDQWQSLYRIGYWAYELPQVPENWRRISQLFHEIWVPSQFVADALKGLPVPVKIVPHYVTSENRQMVAGERSSYRKRFLSEDSDAIIVCVMGDILSSAYRKNILGGISIFKKAFPEEDPNNKVKLVVKVSNGKKDLKILEDIKKSVGTRADIVMFEGKLENTQMDEFFAALDVFLSPHRSEGFGLSIAQAMLASKAVLATNWSGNRDFMADMPESSLINYSLTQVKDPSGVYKDTCGQVWAEPDEGDAALKLREIVLNKNIREFIGAVGRQCIEKSNAECLARLNELAKKK